MNKGEFDLIKHYFKRPNTSNDVVMGIGDDCAVLDVPEGYQLVVTTDTLVSGVHFFENVDPYRLGYKSLAVNLSDLAAMGAKAKWVSLAITLPEVNESWLADFCRGFFALADKHHVQLVGGDTTKGPLSITVSAKGIVKKGRALMRSGAQEGDVVCVSGSLGDGALGLAVKLSTCSPLHNQQAFINALELTEACLELGSLLIDYASSCIDISDGLSQDLSHILSRSACSAKIDLEKIPLSGAMLNEIKLGNVSLSEAWQYAVTGGDDYALAFTIPAAKLAAFKVLLAQQAESFYCFEIGKVMSNNLTSVYSTNDNNKLSTLEYTYQQKVIDFNSTGWDHFKSG